MYSKFILKKVVYESTTIKSFYFEREDGGIVEDFLPGQFVTVKVPLSEGVITRNYTLSDSSGKNYFRLTIKLEEFGKSSPFFHYELKVGDVLEISSPMGNFYLMEDTSPIVLISGGVGITPMMSMLEFVTKHQPEREVYFLHSSLNKAVQPMAYRLQELANLNSNLKLSIFHTYTDGEVQGVDFDHSGFIGHQHLEESVRDGADYFLCGPTPFMEAMYGYLKGLGIADEAINYEFFGEGKSLNGTPVFKDSTNSGTTVTFTASKKEVAWDNQYDSILALAEANGLQPEFSCRMGTCSTCETPVLSGEVSYDPEPFLEPQKGNALICCSKPASDIQVEL